MSLGQNHDTPMGGRVKKTIMQNEQLIFINMLKYETDQLKQNQYNILIYQNPEKREQIQKV